MTTSFSFGQLIRAAFVVVLIAIVIFVWHKYSMHQTDLRVLFERSPPPIDSVTIKGQGKRLVLSGPDVSAYLAKAFRSAVPGGNVAHTRGHSYYMHITLEDGRVIFVGCDCPGGSEGWNVGFPMDSLADPEYYWVPLAEPMPKLVASVMQEMRRS
jgi:hypothetical protein